MAEHETTDDIIAEKRFDATTRDQFDSSYIVDFCDRFEAAHKRESAVGDCAKLREALDVIISGYENADLCDMNYGEWCHDSSNICVNIPLCKAIHEARAAIAAPPRNCDRPECATTASAQAVWRKEDGGKTAYYEWLLATYKEGGNDGNE